MTPEDTTPDPGKQQPPVKQPNPPANIATGGNLPATNASKVGSPTAPPAANTAEPVKAVESTPAPQPQGPSREEAFELAAAGNCDALEGVADSEPNEAEVRYQLGLCQAKAGRNADARKSLATSAELGKPKAQVSVDLARLALAEGNTSEATRQIDAALKAQPGNNAAMTLRGDVLMRQKKFADAATLFDGLLTKTKSKEVCNKLADAYAGNGVGELADSTRRSCSSFR